MSFLFNLSNNFWLYFFYVVCVVFCLLTLFLAYFMFCFWLSCDISSFCFKCNCIIIYVSFMLSIRSVSPFCFPLSFIFFTALLLQFRFKGAVYRGENSFQLLFLFPGPLVCISDKGCFARTTIFLYCIFYYMILIYNNLS